MKTSTISIRVLFPRTIYFLFFAACCLSLNKASAQYSGEEMFRAVFFGEGSAASIIPELQGMSIDYFTDNSEERTQTRQFQNQLVSKVNQLNASFLNGFGQAMATGNHVIIKNKLTEAKSVLDNAAAQLGHIRNASYEAQLTSEVMAILPKGASFETVNQALKDYFQQKDNNAGATQALGGYIHHYFIAWIMSAYEWWYDALDEFSVNYQERLVNSIAENWR
jgi:SdpC family antimicrobial peptide